jgi:hypothetical protein
MQIRIFRGRLTSLLVAILMLSLVATRSVVAGPVAPTPGWVVHYQNNFEVPVAGDWGNVPGASNPSILEPTALPIAGYAGALFEWNTGFDHKNPNNHVGQITIGQPGTLPGSIVTSTLDRSAIFNDAVVGGPWHVHFDYAYAWGDDAPALNADAHLELVVSVQNYEFVHDLRQKPGMYYRGVTMDNPLHYDLFWTEPQMGLPETGGPYRVFLSLTLFGVPPTAHAQAWLDNVLIEEQPVPEPVTATLALVALIPIALVRRS